LGLGVLDAMKRVGELRLHAFAIARDSVLSTNYDI